MLRDAMTYRLSLKAVTVIVLFLLLGFVGYSSAATERGDYFYLQETSSEDSRSSCAQIFADIRAGKEEDVGGVVRSLKTINVTYLLDDYDNVLTTDRRKQNYLTFEELMAEVAANKRESYCRIELAIYMKNDEVLPARFMGTCWKMPSQNLKIPIRRQWLALKRAT